MDGLAVADDVVTAGTALAGLILIYIGGLATEFGGYSAVEQKTVRPRFAGRAWLSFVGFAAALFAAGLAVIAKWMSSKCTADVAVWALLAAFAWAIFATVQTIREIK